MKSSVGILLLLILQLWLMLLSQLYSCPHSYPCLISDPEKEKEAEGEGEEAGANSPSSDSHTLSLPSDMSSRHAALKERSRNRAATSNPIVLHDSPTRSGEPSHARQPRRALPPPPPATLIGSKRPADSSLPAPSTKRVAVGFEADADDSIAQGAFPVHDWLDKVIFPKDAAYYEGHSSEKVFKGVSHYLYQALAVQSEMRKRMSPLLADAKLVPTLRADLLKREKELDDSALRVGQLESELEAEKKKSAEAVATYKSSRAFEDDVLVNARLRLRRLLAMEWLNSDEGRTYLTDLGEEDYHMGSLDMQRDIYPVLLARDPTFDPEKWGLPAQLSELPSRIPATPARQQGAGETDRVTPENSSGGQIPMDSPYLNSAAKLTDLAGMDRNPVPSMLNVSEEEEPAEGGLVRRSRLQSGTNDPPPTGPTEGETVGGDLGA